MDDNTKNFKLVDNVKSISEYFRMAAIFSDANRRLCILHVILRLGFRICDFYGSCRRDIRIPVYGANLFNAACFGQLSNTDVGFSLRF